MHSLLQNLFIGLATVLVAVIEDFLELLNLSHIELLSYIIGFYKETIVSLWLSLELTLESRSGKNCLSLSMSLGM